jgi:hypothetical protein
MFTAGAGKIQIVYCGHSCMGGIRIRLSISEMSMRIVTFQDLQTLTSESGNRKIFFFTSTLDGGECSASNLRLFTAYDENMAPIRYVAGWASRHVQAFCKRYRKYAPVGNRTTNPPTSGK